MASSGPILDYAPNRAPPRKLTLEESDSGMRVIFPVFPAWAYWAAIICGIATGLLLLAFCLVAALRLWRLYNSFGPVPPEVAKTMRRSMLALVTPMSSHALSILGWTAYSWWMFRRWGRVPRALTATSEGLTLSYLGFWRPRERSWPVHETETIELRPVKGNLNWKRTAADLYIRRRKGRRLHFRLSSSDRQLPVRIAEQLAFRLGCPMRR